VRYFPGSGVKFSTMQSTKVDQGIVDDTQQASTFSLWGHPKEKSMWRMFNSYKSNGHQWEGEYEKAMQPVEHQQGRHHRRGSSWTKWFSSMSLTGNSGESSSSLEESPKSQDEIILNYLDADMARWTSDLLDDGYEYRNTVSGKLNAVQVAEDAEDARHQNFMNQKSSPRASSSHFDDHSGSETISVATCAASTGFAASDHGKTHRMFGKSKESGYKSLWKSIRKKRTNDNEGACSVQSLRETVVSMKNIQAMSQSAILRDKLVSLDGDSRAVAALLKELARDGACRHGWMLFDYIRSIPQDDDLHKLADLFTYTTVISQCGSQQRLNKALELFEEMRLRGIDGNIHTYSALMGVCVKHNESSLAVEMYQEALANGCEPNLVTFNILIDAYNKLGMLKSSIEVLDDIKKHRLLPEARTYNSIISACGKACKGPLALEIYQQMIQDGVGPTNTTYTSAISACGRSGMVEDAIRLYRSMPSMGCQPNVITFSSLISVCERAADDELAMSLFLEMKTIGVAPNIVTYNGLLGALSKLGKWEECLQILQEMESHKCHADALSYSAIIAALSKRMKWRLGLEYAEKAQHAGHKLEAGAQMALIGCMWATGRISVQRKAFKMLSKAQNDGKMKMKINSCHESTVIADTASACCLATIKWLVDYRSGLVGASAFQKPLRTLSFTPGKFCAPESIQDDILGSLNTLFQAYGVPAEVILTPRGHLVKTDARMMANWSTSGPAHLLTALCGIENGPNQHASALLKDDNAVFTQCQKALQAAWAFEDSDQVFDKSGQNMISYWSDLRGEMIEHIVSLAGHLKVKEAICHDSVQLCDRLLILGNPYKQPRTPYCAAALILLACRQDGCAQTILKNGDILSERGLSLSAVLEAESQIIQKLGESPAALSPMRILHVYFELLGYGPESQKNHFVKSLMLTASGFVSRAAIDISFACIPPSIVAAVCMSLAFERMGISTMPTSLQEIIADYKFNEQYNECHSLLQCLV
jgi:pentatricopeptide repeat domain-containing protein 1